MRKYEMLTIVAGNITDEEKEKTIASVKELVEKNGATVVGEIDKWGMKKFAYPINYKNEGYYFLMNFEAEDDKISAIANKLNITKNVVRHMIIAK